MEITRKKELLTGLEVKNLKNENKSDRNKKI